MKKITNKKKIFWLVVLCSIVYVISYVTRINYAAVLVEVVDSEGYSKVAASMALTGLFITYAVGQLLNGYLGDKIKPEKMVLAGLLLAAGMNLLMPLCTTVTQMTVVWCINGFAQSMLWPPIVKIMTSRLTNEMYKKTVIYVGWGSSIGTIVVYSMAPVVLISFPWRAVFFIAAALAIVMAVIWALTIHKIQPDTEIDPGHDPSAVQVGKSHVPFTKKAIYIIVLSMVGIAMQGALRDGIATWMPSFVSEVFSADNSTAILTGVALPILSMIVSALTSWINRKWLKNEGLCAGVMFVVCVVSSVALYFTRSASPVAAVAFLALANAASHGINLIYTCLILPIFHRFGKISFMSGLLNSATYVGSSLSMYGIAFITESFGWNMTILTWLLVSVVGAVACFSTIGALDSFKKEDPTLENA